MKTLREYMEILDEISRRDFIKGAGAAAATAAAGKANAFPIIVPLRWPEPNMPVSPEPKLHAGHLTKEDRVLIMRLWYVYEFADQSKYKVYKSFAWEELTKLNMIYDIHNMGQFHAMAKEQIEDAKKQEPEKYNQMYHAYTHQANQDKIIYAGRALVEKGTQELRTQGKR